MSSSIPLRKVRLGLYSLVLVSSVIAGAGCINGIKKTMTAVRHGGSGKPMLVDMSDIQGAIVGLFVLNLLRSFEIGAFLMVMLKDMLRPHWYPRPLKGTGALFSTRTLLQQTVLQVVSIIASLIVLIVATAFAAERAPRVTVPAFMNGMTLFGRYWNQFPVRFAIVASWINLGCATTLAVFSFRAFLDAKRTAAKTHMLNPRAKVSVETIATSGLLKNTVEVPL